MISPRLPKRGASASWSHCRDPPCSRRAATRAEPQERGAGESDRSAPDGAPPEARTHTTTPAATSATARRSDVPRPGHAVDGAPAGRAAILSAARREARRRPPRRTRGRRCRVALLRRTAAAAPRRPTTGAASRRGAPPFFGAPSSRWTGGCACRGHHADHDSFSTSTRPTLPPSPVPWHRDRRERAGGRGEYLNGRGRPRDAVLGTAPHRRGRGRLRASSAVRGRGVDAVLHSLGSTRPPEAGTIEVDGERIDAARTRVTWVPAPQGSAASSSLPPQIPERRRGERPPPALLRLRQASRLCPRSRAHQPSRAQAAAIGFPHELLRWRAARLRGPPALSVPTRRRARRRPTGTSTAEPGRVARAAGVRRRRRARGLARTHDERDVAARPRSVLPTDARLIVGAAVDRLRGPLLSERSHPLPASSGLLASAMAGAAIKVGLRPAQQRRRSDGGRAGPPSPPSAFRSCRAPAAFGTRSCARCEPPARSYARRVYKPQIADGKAARN